MTDSQSGKNKHAQKRPGPTADRPTDRPTGRSVGLQQYIGAGIPVCILIRLRALYQALYQALCHFRRTPEAPKGTGGRATVIVGR